MPRAPAEHSTPELRNVIANYRRLKRTDEPRYLDFLAELGRRTVPGLDFNKSMEIIRKSAAEGRYLSYKNLADRSEVEWNRVRYQIGPHLWSLVEFAHRRGWPMLSAVVVNHENIETGEMAPPALAGFIGAARDLGYDIGDEAEFLREQQKQVFHWAKHSQAM